MDKRNSAVSVPNDMTNANELYRPARFSSILKAATLGLALVFAMSAYAEDRVAERKVPPEYPPAAKALRISGTVKVAVTINPAGTVTKAEAKGGNKLLGVPAEDAVRKWKFAPADSETTQEVEVIFKMKE